MANLRELLLSNNNLTVIPYELGRLFLLQVFTLSGNPLPQEVLQTVNDTNGVPQLITFLLDNLPCMLLLLLLLLCLFVLTFNARYLTYETVTSCTEHFPILGVVVVVVVVVVVIVCVLFTKVHPNLLTESGSERYTTKNQPMNVSLVL